MVQRPSDEATVWRYLDFYQLASILDREQVYFSALSEFEDSFEGSFPVEDSIEADPDEDEEIKRFRERFPKCVFANCWHMNSRESASMWHQYDDRGIAIKTDYKNLRSSFNISRRGVHFFEVKYIDYEEESIEFEHRLDAYRHKRKSYEHEQELRALFTDYPPQEGAESEKEPEGYDNLYDEFDSFAYITREEPIPEEKYVSGQCHDVDVDSLIKEVRINPWNDHDFVKLVESIVEKYNLSAEVEQSRLSDEPLY